jgi:hypothetical protein
MVENNPTNYLNMSKRRIYQGDKGGYFVRRSDGKKLYSPKASYRKVGGNGDETKLKPKNRNSVPVKLRRAVRKNAGVAKGKGKAKKINRVPLLPSRPVVVRHPANRPVAPKKNRVPLLPSPPVVVRHPANRPVAPKKNRVPLLPGRPVVVRHPANRPVNFGKKKINRVPLLPGRPVVVRHPANSPVNFGKVNANVIRKAKFLNISGFVDPNYENNGVINENKLENFMKSEAKDFIKKHKLKNGDIVFTGSGFEGRQEYGFGMIKNGVIMSGHEGIYGMGPNLGVNAMAKNYKLENIDYSNAKRNILNFGENHYMFGSF